MGEYYDPLKHNNSKYPEKPAWCANLEKARQARYRNMQIKQSLKSNEDNKGNPIIPYSERSDEDILYGPEIRYEETPLPDPRDLLSEPDLWFDHCEKVGKKRKPGRAKMSDDEIEAVASYLYGLK